MLFEWLLGVSLLHVSIGDPPLQCTALSGDFLQVIEDPLDESQRPRR